MIRNTCPERSRRAALPSKN